MYLFESAIFKAFLWPFSWEFWWSLFPFQTVFLYAFVFTYSFIWTDIKFLFREWAEYIYFVELKLLFIGKKEGR